MTEISRGRHGANPVAVTLLAVLLGVPAVFHGTTAGMASVWASNETYTHGFLILPIALWLIWQNRPRLGGLPLVPDWRALALLLPCLGVWLLATLVDVALVQQLAMVALMPLTLWLAAGWALVWTLLFPLAYLFFAVPIGDSLIPPLMEFTADFTVYCVKHSGIPVFRDGLSFSLPTGNWAVVEECSGLRYLIASAALGTIFAYISYRSWLKRGVFIIISLLLPILANGVRAYMIVMIGHLSGMRYAVGLDHLLYGWVFFGIVMLLLFSIGSRWRDEDTLAQQPPAQSAQSAPAGATGSPPVRHTARVALAGCIAAAMFAGTQVLAHRILAPPANAGSQTPALPLLAGDWRLSPADAQATSSTAWQPQYSEPQHVITGRYVPVSPARSETDVVTLHLGYYMHQIDGSEAVSSLNKLTDPYGGEWNLLAARWQETGRGGVNEAELMRGSDTLLVWQIYQIGSIMEANRYRAKLKQVRQLLQGRHDGAFIALATPRGEDSVAARQRLRELWQALRAPLQQALDDAATLGSGTP